MQSGLRFVLRLAVAVAALAALAAPTAGSGVALRIRDPETYRSPSGEFELFVDPSDRYGCGGATYRLSRAGVEVWSGERPYTLWDAVVTDEGVAAGYAYGNGWNGYGHTAVPSRNDFRVVILDAEGSERLNWATGRARPREGTILRPLARSVEIDAAEGLLIVRAQIDPLATQDEHLLRFRLADGEAFETLPAPALPRNAAPRPDDGPDPPAIELERLGELWLRAPDEGPDQAEFREILVDPLCRVFAIEPRPTGALFHQFDCRGAFVQTVATPVTIVEGACSYQTAMLDSEGSIYFGPSMPWDLTPLIKFTSDGAWVGETGFPGVTFFNPGRKTRWWVWHESVSLLPEFDDGEIVKHVRTPGNRWLHRAWGAAMAPDGSLAVLMRDDESLHGSKSPALLCLYGPDGSPRREVRLPRRRWRFFRMAHGDRWVVIPASAGPDGEHLYLVNALSGEARHWPRAPEPGDCDPIPICPPGRSEVWLATPESGRVVRYRLPD